MKSINSIYQLYFNVNRDNRNVEFNLLRTIQLIKMSEL